MRDNIPALIKDMSCWVLWKYEQREDGKLTKVPYSVHGGRGSTTNLATWAEYDATIQLYDRGGYDGIGICVTDGIGAIDIDHCVMDGKLSSMAAEIVAKMNCYTEFSPSGQGIRILFRAAGFQYDSIRYYKKNPHNGLEIYIAGCTDRYVTITGNALGSMEIEERSAQIADVMEAYMVRPNAKSCQETPKAVFTAGQTAAEVINRIRYSKQGMLFDRLMAGDTSGHNDDDSAADMALCNILAFATGKDMRLMDEIFRMSKLFGRGKWDSRRGATTYGKMTLERAVRDCSEVYSPPSNELVISEAKEPFPRSPPGQVADNHTLVSLDQITPTPPRYFWEPYIRLHNINLIRGDGGVGKTMFIMAIAAAITNGKKPEGMPGTLNVEQGAVIYYGAEDDPSEYANRAMLCGCDRRFLHVISEGGTLPHLSDVDVIRQQIRQTGAKLIVIDPIQSMLGTGTDMNKANEVRPMLDGLRALCQEVDCTAIIIEHLNKATQQKAHYRGIGTVDIINACRSALMIGWHPEQKGLSVVVQIKANAKYGQPVAFSINGEGVFSWQGLCNVTEDEVANARRFGVASDAREVIDPVLALVLALMEKYTDGWTGTASQMLAEGSALVDCSLLTKPESIGRKLPGIHHELKKRGITWTKKKATHSFSKRPQLMLMTPPGEDG